MSLKSILYSIIAIVLAGGLLFLDIVLFGIASILGIVGIVLILVLPGFFLHKARSNASGLLDRLLARLIAPILIVVVGFFTLMYILVWSAA